MWWNTVQMILLIGTFLYMVNKARSAQAKKLTVLPLAMAMIEILVGGVLNPGEFVILSVILMAARLTVIGCCVAVIRRDEAAARARRRQKARAAAAVQRQALVAGRPVGVPVGIPAGMNGSRTGGIQRPAADRGPQRAGVPSCA